MTLKLIKVSSLTSLEVPCLCGLTLSSASEIDLERKNIQCMENTAMEQALMGKVMIHLRGVNNCSVSMCTHAHFIPPKIQLPDQLSGHRQ